MVKIEDKCTALHECVLKMSTRVSQMYEMALDVIESADRETALKIIRMDEYVNYAEEEINDLAVEALALLSPVATDLRVVICAIKIASDLERIADYAKSMASFVIKAEKIDEELVHKAKELGDIVLAMLDHAMNAYDAKDGAWAMLIPEEDEQIDAIFDEIMQILEEKMTDKEAVHRLIPAVGMLRNLERAGDHIKNICEHTIFQLKGQHIEFN